MNSERDASGLETGGVFGAPVFRMRHMGVAVPELEPALLRLRTLFGYRVVSGPFRDPIQKVEVIFLALGEVDTVELELVAPLAEDSPIRSMLARGKGGAYHLCFEVDDLAEAIEHSLRSECVVVSGPAPAVAFDGRQIAWIYTPLRQLVELVEALPK